MSAGDEALSFSLANMGYYSGPELGANRAVNTYILIITELHM